MPPVAVVLAFIISAAAVLSFLVAASPAAQAAYTSAGSGTGSVSTGFLASPTSVTVPSTTTGAVPVSWTAPVGVLTPVAYYVVRSTNGVRSPACGTTPGSSITATSCTDSPPTAGPHTYTVTAVHKSWTSTSNPSGSVTLTAGKLVFTVQPSDVAANGTITPSVQVALQSTQGVPVRTPNQPITLAIGANPGGSNLTGTLTATTGTDGTATFSDLHLDKLGTGYTLTATSSGIPAATSTGFAVTASVFVFTTAATNGIASATAGQGPITVQRVNSAGTPITASSGGLSLTLASTTAGSASFAASPNGQPITTITIPNGASSATFYYGDTRAGSPVVRVSATGVTAGSQTQTVTAAPASKLAYTTQPLSGTTSTTADLGPLTVQLQDPFNNPVVAPAAGVPVRLASTTTGTAVFSPTQGATATAATATIPSGSSSLTFYYGDTRTGTATISATAGSLPAASQAITLTSPVATQLAITSPAVTGTATATTTLGPITVQLRDAAGLPVTALGQGTTLTVASTSPGTTRVSSTQGATTTGTITIPAGATSTTFYYSDTLAGTPTVTVAAPGLTNASQQVTVRAAAPARLTYLSAPTRGQASSTTNVGPMTVQLEDSFGNPSPAPAGGTLLNLTSTSAGTRIFSTTRGTTTSTPTITIPEAATSTTLYYADTAAGTPTLTVTGANLTSAAQQQTITAAAPAQVQFLQNPTNVRKGVPFSPTITATIVDQYGNRTTSTAAATLELRTSTGATGARGNLGGSTTVNAVNGIATFTGLTVGGPASGPYTLLATSSLLTSGLSSVFIVG
ncbi:beta strand repeat-containing protein [Arthrobacter sp. MDT3-44]